MTEIKTFTYELDGKEYDVVWLDNEQLPCCASYFGSNMFGELWLGVDGKLYIK